MLFSFAFVTGLGASAAAQLTVTPGPGGVPIAPGAPVRGYTPGGTSFGGVEIAPGPAARELPMYREGPGGVPVLVTPRRRTSRSGALSRSGVDCGGGPCAPQSLQLTITSRADEEGKAPARERPLNAIGDLFTALRACWEAPAREDAQAGMQMSVRVSYRRSGELMGPPFVTYAKAGAGAETKRVYRRAIDAALARCGRLRFSKSFGAAIAGRPISIRYVDDRRMRSGAP